MTHLEAVATYLPPESVSIDEALAGLDISETQIRLFQRFYGFSRIRREPKARLADQMLSTAAGLTELHGREKDVRYVVQALTLPVAAPYPSNPVHDVRRALGLDHAVTFCLTQHACATGLLAVDVCGKLLAADGDPNALALIFTGEKAYTAYSQKFIIDTAVMGEGMAAILVRQGGDHDEVISYVTRTHGQFNQAPWLTHEQAREFDQLYPEALAEVMLAAIEQAGLTLADITFVLPHHVNHNSWKRLSKRIELPMDRIFLENLPEVGHCFCADPFINYLSVSETGRLRPGEYYMMVSVGLGATFSAMVLRH
ncbi:3-oxoacyl-[acyl-carrier-protein] synthase III C-terminal domain-containing protein [Pseudonocardia alaniniphila]|uniref:3-oxoacyl-ACP synthase n=1 Tax=Pseudonocardia alaniniphila TaxID=75291 RepID=A0ABS9TF52_9PSEU|nr:3-oxoacyl-[acyl-carrier-protein] synthase III C-terminal domain-containing protein [Pseudonocardia alaniniphila]MCH6167156.1 3-oxoacyl-ACP synthase [Pseudonocardia alaniniphila]